MERYLHLLHQLPGYLAQSTPQYWADLGCGNGVFTEVLANFLPAQSRIIAVDKSDHQLAQTMGDNVSVAFQRADFTEANLQLPELDGILMANALHFVKDKETLIKKLEKHFKSSPQFLIVEYDHTQPNRWVPYPVPFEELKKIFLKLGYHTIERIGDQRSLYGGIMYAAIIY